MNQLRILPPDKLRSKARAKVKKFQLEKRRRELEEKLRPKRKAGPKNKLYFVGREGVVIKGDLTLSFPRVTLKLDRIEDWKASFTVEEKDGEGRQENHYYWEGYESGESFDHKDQMITVAAIQDGLDHVQVSVKDLGDPIEVDGSDIVSDVDADSDMDTDTWDVDAGMDAGPDFDTDTDLDYDTDTDTDTDCDTDTDMDTDTDSDACVHVPPPSPPTLKNSFVKRLARVILDADNLEVGKRLIDAGADLEKAIDETLGHRWVSETREARNGIIAELRKYVKERDAP
ncbi:MAG: hypothetical protein GY852_03530 [bacterium]|nr:hypothetical protein [bacterium]